MGHNQNLTVQVLADGVFLKFTAWNGAEAVLSVEDLAERFNGSTRETFLAWCHDRRNDHQIKLNRAELLAEKLADQDISST